MPKPIDCYLRGIDAAADLEALSDPTEAKPLAARTDETLDLCLRAIDFLGEQAEALCRRTDAYVEGQQQRKSCEP